MTDGLLPSVKVPIIILHHTKYAMARTRISITIPEELVRAADERARDLDRSRSWVVAEALRRYLEPGVETGVSEPPASRYATGRGLGAYRLAQLEADFALKPEQRVREAERTARVGELIRRRGRPAHYVLLFDRYEEYLEWERRQEQLP